MDVGRTPHELRTFLDERALHGIPATARQLLSDIEARAGQVRDLGMIGLIECADPTVVTLLSRDGTLRGLCRQVGERHLVRTPAAEPKPRAALRRLGYPLGPGS